MGIWDWKFRSFQSLKCKLNWEKCYHPLIHTGCLGLHTALEKSRFFLFHFCAGLCGSSAVRSCRRVPSRLGAGIGAAHLDAMAGLFTEIQGYKYTCQGKILAMNFLTGNKMEMKHLTVS